jgi:PIF1-like helicase/Helix-turn-helix domain
MPFEYSQGEPAALASQFINNTTQNVFLTGNAGTGKTTFLKHVIEQTHKKVVVVAPTGIAALNAGGVTIHSMFQLPFGSFAPVRKLPFVQGNYGRIHDTDAIVKNMQMNETKRQLIKEMELLIIDEVSMLRADLLDAIDFVLRFVRRKMNTTFGGVQVLFIGDMLQLPPVVKDDEWAFLKQYYNSPFFFDAQVITKNGLVYVELEKIYRQTDNRFISLLNNLRNNVITSEDKELLNQYYKPSFKPSHTEGYITLTTHNHKADKINKAALEELPTPKVAYRASVDGEFGEFMYPIDTLLELKVGAQVMFIKNDLSPEKKFYNGKIATVTKLDTDTIEVKCAGEEYPIEVTLHEWEHNKFYLNDTNNEIEQKKVGSFKHYPLKLAWAITVHKSQGLTFDKAIIDVQDAFASGQIYVALSRLRSLDGLVLTSAVPSNAFKVEQNVIDFAKSKLDKEVLMDQIKNDTGVFLQQQIQQSFDLNTLYSAWLLHANSYTKEENRSRKQSSAEWAVQRVQAIKEIKNTTDKFLAQLLHILSEQKDNYLSFLQERLTASLNYYEPKLKEQSVEVFKQMEIISKDSGVKEYLQELKELETAQFEQLKNMRKSVALVKAIAEGRELTKKEINKINPDSERMTMAINAQQMIQSQKKSGRGGSANPARKRKITTTTDKPKKEKGATQRESLEMFKQGKTVNEIAEERKLTATTIFGHLAGFVATGDLAMEQLVPEKKIVAIRKAMEEYPESLVTPLKALLGDEYSYNEISLVMNDKKKNAEAS